MQVQQGARLQASASRNPLVPQMENGGRGLGNNLMHKVPGTRPERNLNPAVCWFESSPGFYTASQSGLLTLGSYNIVKYVSTNGVLVYQAKPLPSKQM